MRFAILLCGLLLAMPATASEPAWAALRSGLAVALIRHAEAPGTGDPPGFRLDDCGTQRNLSAAGRAQARRIGDALRARGIGDATVLTSAWCRCRDTAAELRLGTPDMAAPLNSFFGNGDPGGRQTDALRRLIDALPAGQPAILVTHQVNITALTQGYPASGEIVLVQRGSLAVLHRERLAAP